MDKKALKILMKTYWSTAGWTAENERLTTPDDLQYAKRAGIIFDPIRLSHDEMVRQAIEVRTKVDLHVVARAFLSSLTSRQLEIRSALGSYAVLQYMPPTSIMTGACSVLSAESPMLPNRTLTSTSSTSSGSSGEECVTTSRFMPCSTWSGSCVWFHPRPPTPMRRPFSASCGRSNPCRQTRRHPRWRRR
jgi:hypothetical protein